MEKYSKWRDAATGIHPFLPIKGKGRDDGLIGAVLWFLGQWVFGSLLALTRITLLAVVFAVVLVLSSIIEFVPVFILRRPLLRLIQGIGARTMLLLMGFWWISSKTSFLSKQQQKANANAKPEMIKPSDIVIANHCSYVDILYLSFRFSPLFSAPPNTWSGAPPRGVLIPRTFWQALKAAIAEPPQSQDDAILAGKLIQRTKNNKAGPLIIFPEATTSNGRTLLDTLPALSADELTSLDTARVHVLGFKYEDGLFSATYTVGSFLAHLFRLCSQPVNRMQVLHLARADVPSLPLDGSKGENVTVDDVDEWFDAVVRNLGSMLHVRRAKLNAMDKRDFLNYWHGHKQLYRPASKNK